MKNDKKCQTLDINNRVEEWDLFLQNCENVKVFENL